MVLALGYSNTAFLPTRPGRLCRGRERWVQAWPEDNVPQLHRLVLTGAAFSDDSARDALRGLNRSGLHMGELLLEVLPGKRLVAFKEQGELGMVPPEVQDDERLFSVPRQGGHWREGCQRWHLEIRDAEHLQELLEQDNIDGVLVLEPGQEVDEALERALYILCGMGDDSHFPVKRFQPLGIVEVLEHASALVAVHLDKHGPSIAVYTHEPLDVEPLLRERAEQAGSLAVPFAIPPMLARWDRALQELRVQWMSERDDEFPVPPAEEPTRWSRLGRKRVAELQEE
ncbi:MAG: hypothetical protein VX899_17405 [Myxococcota bacterium]|nr:hypothetical protein [Myxococcota bacterium]